MAKKQFFLIIDTETTVDNKVFDFGATVVDRKGNIVQQCSIVVKDVLQSELFYDPKDNGFWGKKAAITRKAKYMEMVNSGSRMIASVNAINRWLEKVIAKYNPILTAYNISFDADKCRNTGIDLNGFTNRFCLWHLAVETFAKTKSYRQFVLNNHYFGRRTEKGNLTYLTNAEVMAHYVTGNFSVEPHTAIEDIIGYELPIMVAILKKRNWKDNIGIAYDWKNHQVKDHFKA